MRLKPCQMLALTIFTTVFPAFAFSATYLLPQGGNDIIGERYYDKAQPGDTLASIGLRNGMSYHEMIEANPKLNRDARIGTGRKVLIPAQFILPPYRKGIVINLAELRLYYFPPSGDRVMTFPVAMGRDEWRTPTGKTTVVSKEKDPIWNVPESIRNATYENKGELLPERVYPGPENPLGPYALYLGISGYLIHGNNAPNSIGKFVSSGCIRMNNADITTLFNLVKVGTPVHIVHYPNKVGWFNGVLYQESQMPVELPEGPGALNQTELDATIDQATNKKQAMVDWKASREIEAQHSGLPEPIGTAASGHADNSHVETTPPQAIIDVEGEDATGRSDQVQISFYSHDQGSGLSSQSLDRETER